MYTRIAHIEDKILFGGSEGIEQAADTIEALHYMLIGHSDNSVNVSMKWDGAPSIVAGTDPTDGRFFVATKSYFNKIPVMYKTTKEINDKLSGDLANKLKLALAELPKLGFDGILQGDFLYTRQDLNQGSAGNSRYLMFKPNTLVYAVPLDSDLAGRIRRSKMGIAWHTSHTGQFKGTVDRMKDVSTVWSVDADYKDVSGTATFTQAEASISLDLQMQMWSNLSTVPEKYIDHFKDNREIGNRLSEFVRKYSSNGNFMGSARQVAEKFAEYIHDYYEAEIEKRSTPRAKESAANQFAKGAAPVIDGIHHFEAMIESYTLAVKLKKLLLKKLNTVADINTFIEMDNGYRVADPEGFVVVDRMSNDVVKLVDKMSYTKANSSRNVFKGFAR